MSARPLPSPLSGVLFLLVACWTPEQSRESADRQVYPMLESTAAKVAGQPKTFALERSVDTLRRRLQEGGQPVQLSLLDSLDVAAENSRDFQRQKELLYLAALNLTRSRHDFEVHWGGGGAAEISGVGNDSADVSLSDDLSASVTSASGTRLVASFVNTFLRSVMHGGSFDGSSILNLTLTQPLLRGAGAKIVREPLTQAERDLVYQMRTFERFRATFATQVVSDYYGVVQQIEDLKNVEANYQSVSQQRIRTQAEYDADRKTINDLGREKQSELNADNGRVLSRNRLEAALDRFKLTLGLPTTAKVTLDPAELDHLKQRGITPLAVDEAAVVNLALQRRYDHRTVLDSVEDAARRVVVSEDALKMGLDFTAALSVPSQSGPGLNLDWSKVNWSAGFDLDLALDKLVERNAYRSALITLDGSIRTREESEDRIAQAIRTALRDINSDYQTFQIQVQALRVAELRVESTTLLYDAGRAGAIDVLDAKDALLSAQLALTAAVVQYSIARLELLRDMEGIAMEPKGLRFDPALPLPAAPAEEHP
jgi:outer membrane protein TolC